MLQVSNELAQRLGITKKLASSVTSEVLNIIIDKVKSGEITSIKGLVSFKHKVSKAKSIRVFQKDASGKLVLSATPKLVPSKNVIKVKKSPKLIPTESKAE